MAAEEAILGQHMITAEDPIREQNVVGLVVPGIVRQVALREEPYVPPALCGDAIGVGGAATIVVKLGQVLSDLREVVGIDVVKETRPHEFRQRVAHHQNCMLVNVDDIALLAHTHVEREVDVVHSDG